MTEIFPHDPLPAQGGNDIPDRQNTTSLSETSLLLNTTDTLLQDGGDLSRGSLSLSGVRADLLGGTGDGAGDSRANLQHGEKFVNDGLVEGLSDRRMLNGLAR